MVPPTLDYTSPKASSLMSLALIMLKEPRNKGEGGGVIIGVDRRGTHETAMIFIAGIARHDVNPEP